MTLPRPIDALALGIALAALAGVGVWHVLSAAINRERTEARAQAVSAMRTMSLPEGIKVSDPEIACGVPPNEGVCLTSALTPRQTATALSPVLEASSDPQRTGGVDEVPVIYVLIGTVDGEPVLASISADLVGVNPATRKLRFDGSTVALGLLEPH